MTVAALLLLTFATGLADAISILVLGHVFVANMTGNVIFLGFWLAPKSSIDLTAVVVASHLRLHHDLQWPAVPAFR